MEYKHNVYVLASIVVLLCISWGTSYWQNKSRYVATNIDITNTHLTSSFEGLSMDQIYDLITPSFYSGNVSLIAKIIAQFSASKAHDVIEHSIEKEKILSYEQIILLICAVAQKYESEKDREKLFSLFSTHSYLYETQPLLYVIAKSEYMSLLSEIVAWTAKELPDNTYAYDAYVYAIKENNVELFKSLLAQQVLIVKNQADTLLETVIMKDNDAQFVNLLVQELNADPNYSSDNKKTVLMYAAELGHALIVSALLSVGADKDIMLDVKVGTALQIAIRNAKTKIELLLRESGARE